MSGKTPLSFLSCYLFSQTLITRMIARKVDYAKCVFEVKVNKKPGAPNSAKFRGGGGCRFDKGGGGVTKSYEFLRDKSINFLEVLR